jgi:hypothetical protein
METIGAEMADRQRTKLLTFESWVRHPSYYQYAKEHPEQVPFILADRSPCTDPFFDLYAAPHDRRPLISGLCRGLKNFRRGDRMIYVARVDNHVQRALAQIYPDLAIDSRDRTTRYFGVAALRVIHVWDTHLAAAADFRPRRYVVAPDPTPYPPNLAHTCSKDAAVARESCVVHTATGAHTPATSTSDMWGWQINEYHLRQKRWALQAAQCEVEWVAGHEALRIDPASAPVFTRVHWGDLKPNLKGIWIPEAAAASLRESIAQGRSQAFKRAC